MQAFKDKLEAISRRQKLLLTAAVVVGGLCFYALGIVTGFFGNKIFSAFWVLGNQGAFDVGYIILAAAAVICIGALIYRFSGKLRLRFKRMTPKDRLITVLVAAVYVLLLFGVGIATNFFENPVFSGFFVISRQTSYYIGYGIVAAAVAICVVILILVFQKNRQVYP